MLAVCSTFVNSVRQSQRVDAAARLAMRDAPPVAPPGGASLMIRHCVEIMGGGRCYQWIVSLLGGTVPHSLLRACDVCLLLSAVIFAGLVSMCWASA